MKVAISIPNRLFKDAEAAAKGLGVSRSKLIQTALEYFLKHRREDALTESINRYIAKYGADLSEEDEAWMAHGQETVRRALEEDDAHCTASTNRRRTLPRRPHKQP